MNKKPSQAAQRIGKAIVDLRRNPHNRAIQRKIYMVGDHELTPVQVDILETIVANPGQQMNELAQALGVNASTVSRTIMPLVDLGLIERRSGEKDRRQTQLLATQTGLRQAETIARSRHRMMQAVQGHFSAERLELFADLLEQYIEAVSAEGIALLNVPDRNPRS